MIYMSKTQKRFATITSLVYLTMIAVCIILLYRRGLDSLPTISVLNIGIEIFAMMVGYMLFITCLVDIQKSGSDLRWFVYLLNITIIWAFTDAGAWLLDGFPDMRILNLIDNTVLFLCTPISAFCFWKYLTGLLVLNHPFERFLNKLIPSVTIIAVILRIINIFTGMYFFVDAEGVYQRGTLYTVSTISALLVLAGVATVAIVERKQLRAYQIVAAVLYIVAPFIATIVTVLVYGLSIGSSVLMLILMLMYCILNVTQGREKAVVDRDLAVASSIQKNVLPMVFPYLPDRHEFNLYATMTPAREVGGDFYDFFMIDDDRIALVIADVSGKGMPAALFMMVSRTIIKNQTQGAANAKDPKKILARVNDQLCEGNEMGFFVTAWLGIISLSTGHLEYASAGHEYPAIRTDGGNFRLLKEKNSPPLAAMDDIEFRGGSMDLKKGDAIFIYTDGVTEATNAEEKLFGTDRMLEALNVKPNSEVGELDANVKNAIDEFVGDTPQFDDITMLAFRYNGVEESPHFAS